MQKVANVTNAIHGIFWLCGSFPTTNTRKKSGYLFIFAGVMIFVENYNLEEYCNKNNDKKLKLSCNFRKFISLRKFLTLWKFCSKKRCGFHDNFNLGLRNFFAKIPIPQKTHSCKFLFTQHCIDTGCFLWFSLQSDFLDA